MSSIKETIRAEIERRREKWLAASRLIKKGRDQAMYAAGKSSAYEEFLSFIDSLPDECLADKRKTSDEPVTDSHDLEEEIQNAIDKYPLNKEDMSEDDIATYHQGLIFGARHFAEWGAKHKDSLQVPETCKENAESFTSLEEAASRGGFDYVDEIEAKAPGLPWNDHDVEFGYRDGFIAGAEWQKIEAGRGYDSRDLYEAYEQGRFEQKEQMMKDAVEAKVWESEHGFRDLEVDSESFRKALEGFKDGDKVKLIIVK